MSAEHVEVHVEKRGGGTLVRVTGVLDALALPEVSRELTDAQRGQGPVYVDLEGVTFMDSRGLGALLAANERAREGAPPSTSSSPRRPCSASWTCRACAACSSRSRISPSSSGVAGVA